MKTIEPVPDFEASFLEAAGALAESLSLNRNVGQLYALSYIRRQPVSLDEMAQALRISKGSASVHIRVLEGWNAVRKVRGPTPRKDYYVAEPDLMKVALERLEKGLAKRCALLDEKMESLEGQLEATVKDKRQRGFYKERLGQILELKALAGKALTLMPRIRSSHKAALKRAPALLQLAQTFLGK